VADFNTSWYWALVVDGILIRFNSGILKDRKDDALERLRSVGGRNAVIGIAVSFEQILILTVLHRP